MERYIKPLIYSKYESTNGIIPLAAVGAAVGAAIGAAAAEASTAAAAGAVAGMMKVLPFGSRDNHLILTRAMTLQEG